MKFPVMTVSRHRTEIESLKESHACEIAKLKTNHEHDRFQAGRRHTEELEQTKAQIDDLVKRIAHITLHRLDGKTPCFRVAVDIDPYMIMYAFEHGDSQRDLDLIAQRIGYQVRQELSNINVWRSAEYGRRMAGRYGDHESAYSCGPSRR